MPTRNALATIRLRYDQPAPKAPFRIAIQVWSHSYDHPNAARRNALVTGVYLVELEGGSSSGGTNPKITDRYGVDHTLLWAGTGGGASWGYEGYTEGSSHGRCPPDLPGVFWTANSGVYDERCLADPACDAMRLQTYRHSQYQLGNYNYLLGPVTFAFDLALSAPPRAVRIRFGHVGGNGGNPAQRTATLPDEEFVIRF